MKKERTTIIALIALSSLLVGCSTVSVSVQKDLSKDIVSNVLEYEEVNILFVGVEDDGEDYIRVEIFSKENKPFNSAALLNSSGYIYPLPISSHATGKVLDGGMFESEHVRFVANSRINKKDFKNLLTFLSSGEVDLIYQNMDKSWGIELDDDEIKGLKDVLKYLIRKEVKNE